MLTEAEPMNTLTLRVTRENWHGGPTYELVVDGRLLADWLDDLNEGIPWWLAKQGLPVWKAGDDGADVRTVTVCSCGYECCGHSRCTIRIQGDAVIFEDFAGDAARTASKLRFVFPRDQYESFSKSIIEQSAQYIGDK